MPQEVFLLTEQEAADFLAMSPHTLRDWRAKHQGPPYLKLRTGAVRYSQTDLTAWVQEERVDPSASAVSE